MQETSGNDDENALLLKLSAADAAGQQSLLQEHLRDLVAHVLQLDVAQVTGQEALTSLGMDSMMAIEVKHRIASSVKVDISVLELLQGVTMVQLATRLLSSLQLESVVPEQEEKLVVDEVEQLIAQADSDELERLLAELEQASESENEATV